MTMSTTSKRFSMIREFHLADWSTLANAVCGAGALFSIMTYLQEKVSGTSTLLARWSSPH
jgi:CDP-diacylglycerol---serine O-phosphatidyltransferase